MSLIELRNECKNVKSFMIKKIPNGVGNFNYQGFNVFTGKYVIGCFKTYEDAVTFFYFEGFVNEQHLSNSVILSR